MSKRPSEIQIARDLWRAQHGRPAGILRRQRRRLATLVAHARARSPYYGRLYADLPVSPELQDLPPTSKPEMMAAFDDWLTDRTISRSALETFVGDPALAGTPYREELFVCTTSGTTGHPGLFVHDQNAIAVFQAMVIARLDLDWFSALDWLRLVRRGLRWAAVVGTGGHFGGMGWVEFQRHRSPLMRRAYRVFSVQRPLAELVEALNAFDPGIITSYPSALELLAEEQAAGRLHVRPTAIEAGGETTSHEARARMSAIFRRPVREVYACSEFLSMAWDCAQGWLHVSSDWVILEPVDAELRPTPPGTPSHTVLLTSLADRLQPIIRYDLGDSILVKPDPCPCGSPFPAIRVEGRRDDVLKLTSADGRVISVLPLAISAALEAATGVHRSQLVQTGPSALRLLLEHEARVDGEAVWGNVVANLHAYLADQGLANVALVRAHEPPVQDPRSGKLRQVIAWRHDRGPEPEAAPMSSGVSGAALPVEGGA